MQPVVAVIDSSPIYRTGLSAGLREEGFAVESVPEPLPWAEQPGLRVPVVTLRTPAAWKLLHQLASLDAGDELVPVAVVLEATPRTVREALRSGARGVTEVAAPVERVAVTVREAAARHMSLPARVVHAFVADAKVCCVARDVGLSPWEMAVLQDRAEGRTWSAIARHHSISERHLRRRRQAILARLGVATWAEAVAHAAAGHTNTHQRPR